MPPQPEATPADAKRGTPPPLMLLATTLVVVGVAAAVPVALYLQANRGPRAAVAVAGDSEAGASSAAQVEPLPSTAAPAVSAVTAVRSGASSETADAGAKAGGGASAKAGDAEAEGPGFLTIRTVPTARVSARGRVLCTHTPCAKLPLAPGVHTITLESTEEALKTSFTVTITSGETVTKHVTLKP